MKLLTAVVLGLLLLAPARAVAQGSSPIPDHWLTLDSLGAILGLSEQEKAQVGSAYAGVNQVLADAYRRREELRTTFMGMGPVAQMSEAEREALLRRLDEVRVEYEGRQANLDGQLSALRSLLSPSAQTRFDGLPKPRVAPQSQ